jgi:hypothetical protein
MKKFFSFKIFFWILLIIAIMEGFWIYLSTNLSNRINLPLHSFYDSGEGLVTAEGAWVTPIKVAFPLSTVIIECWKEFGHCWIADATISDNTFLTAGLGLKEISEWNKDYIQTKPSEPLMGCVEESYRLDRKSKIVTYTRRTVKTSDACEGISEEPIVAKLGDGYERLKLYKEIK